MPGRKVKLSKDKKMDAARRRVEKKLAKKGNGKKKGLFSDAAKGAY